MSTLKWVEEGSWLALTKVLILNFSFRKVSIAREVSKIICRKLLNAKYSTKYEIMEK